MDTHWSLLLRAGVVLSACMAGARYVNQTPPTSSPREPEPTCKTGEALWRACGTTDPFVSPEHLVDPYVMGFIGLLLMNMPVLVLSHVRRLQAVKETAATALVLLALMGAVHAIALYWSRAVAYALTLHGITLWLHSGCNPHLFREGAWVRSLMGYGTTAAIFSYAAHIGPPLVLLGNHPRALSETCGLVAHLVGIVCTEPVLDALFPIIRGILGLRGSG